MDPQKQCNTCGEWKLLSLFHKDKSKKDGHMHMCAACRGHYKRDRAWRNKRREGIRIERTYRTCTICKARKELTEFPVDRSTKTGRRGQCSECKNRRQRRKWNKEYNKQMPHDDPESKWSFGTWVSKPIVGVGSPIIDE